jgi:hypothetical protein
VRIAAIAPCSGDDTIRQRFTQRHRFGSIARSTARPRSVSGRSPLVLRSIRRLTTTAVTVVPRLPVRCVGIERWRAQGAEASKREHEQQSCGGRAGKWKTRGGSPAIKGWRQPFCGPLEARHQCIPAVRSRGLANARTNSPQALCRLTNADTGPRV